MLEFDTEFQKERIFEVVEQLIDVLVAGFYIDLKILSSVTVN